MSMTVYAFPILYSNGDYDIDGGVLDNASRYIAVDGGNTASLNLPGMKV